MIPTSVNRFSEQIMLKQEDRSMMTNVIML